MKFDHKVKHRGKWYMPGQEVPEEKKGNSFPYNKTEINRMPTSELQELANKVGIENAYSINGGDLKSILIEKFQL